MYLYNYRRIMASTLYSYPFNLNEPVTSKLPEIAADPVNGNPSPAPPAFKANEAVVANEEVPITLP